MTNMYFQVASFFYMLMILILFFSKERIKNKETNLFIFLSIVNIIGIILDIIIVYLSYVTPGIPPLYILNKFYLLYIIYWVSLFCLYVSNISIKKKYSKIKKYIFILNTVSTVVVLLIPINLFNENNIMYTYGPSVTVTYFIVAIYVFIMLGIVGRNIKRVISKKYSPILILLALSCLGLIVRRINPALLLTTTIMTYINVLMYHTIENPDLKMIEELSKRKDINDKVNEGKSNFLFHVTETVKKFTERVENISNQALEQETVKEKDECIRDIKYITSNARIKLNETINISTLDARNIKVVGNRYQFHNLIKEINIRTKKSIKGNIEYRSYISADIPDKLYGDSVKVKQILTTILNNAIKHTERGFIEFRINSIQKYDVCRLLITVEDSGNGIDMKTVNDILSSTKDMNIEEIEKIQESNLNLKMVKKLLQVIGGTLNIESNVGVGTTITVTINQKIIEEKKNKEIEKYENMIEKKKKVLVVIENEKNQKQLERLLKKETKLEIVTSSQECLNKIRDKNKYDYLFIQEDMSKIGAKELVKKLYQEEKIDSKVVILREKQELEIMRENIEGVDNYLYFPIKKENLRNILEEDE